MSNVFSRLRAPKAPDANADMGTHLFTYAIMPHAGKLHVMPLLSNITAMQGIKTLHMVMSQAFGPIVEMPWFQEIMNKCSLSCDVVLFLP